MKQNRNRQRNKNQQQVKTKVIRCDQRRRLVFEHEVCEQFISKPDATFGLRENCKNCKYSF